MWVIRPGASTALYSFSPRSHVLMFRFFSSCGLFAQHHQSWTVKFHFRNSVSQNCDCPFKIAIFFINKIQGLQQFFKFDFDLLNLMLSITSNKKSLLKSFCIFSKNQRDICENFWYTIEHIMNNFYHVSWRSHIMFH